MTREEAIKLLEHISIAYTPTDAYGDYDDPRPYEEAIDMAIEALQAEYEDYEHATLVDIKEPLKVLVVRCKDCKNWRESHSEDEESYCYIDGRTTDSTGYCSWAERKKPTIPMFKEAEDAYKEWTGEDIGCKSFTADEWYRHNFKDGDE